MTNSIGGMSIVAKRDLTATFLTYRFLPNIATKLLTPDPSPIEERGAEGGVRVSFNRRKAQRVSL
jgi:hypothetical protein